MRHVATVQARHYCASSRDALVLALRHGERLANVRRLILTAATLERVQVTHTETYLDSLFKEAHGPRNIVSAHP